MVHPAVVVLRRVDRQPEQGGAGLGVNGEAEAGEDRHPAVLEGGEVTKEGGHPGPTGPLVLGAPVVNMYLNLSTNTIVDNVVLIRGSLLLTTNNVQRSYVHKLRDSIKSFRERGQLANVKVNVNLEKKIFHPRSKF